MTGVYMIRNNVTKRIYVGSSQNVEARLHMHLLQLRRGAHYVEDMQNDFNRYGEESFEFRPLMPHDGKGKKTRLEYFMMEVLRTHDPKYGYNHKDRGGTGKDVTAESFRSELFGFPMHYIMNKHHINLYDKVALMCEEHGISIKQFEKEIGLSNGSVSRWRASAPRINTVAKTAEYFGITIHDLIGDVDFNERKKREA